MNKVLINASNLHAGGGIQVAMSFLYELSVLKGRDFSFLDIIVSSEVSEGLAKLDFNHTAFGHYEVLDSFGIKAYLSRLNGRIKNYDAVFTVFGPNYLRVKAKTEIVGFAQLWNLQFKNPISEKMTLLRRSFLRAKFFVYWLFFSRANIFVVELDHVKRGLISSKGVAGDKIFVVHNTVASIYLEVSKWTPIHIQKNNEEVSLGLVTRDYPHKNIDIFADVAEILEDEHNLKVHFYVTLNDMEWANKSLLFKKYVSTVGALSPDQCPSFYEQIDGVVFPSLLECFSATPLEALVMRKPLFASNRDFVRDVCGHHAEYFDPLDAGDIAQRIASFFNSNIDRTFGREEAREYALRFSSPRFRAKRYLEIIQQNVQGYINAI